MDNLATNFWETIYRQNIARMTGICYRYTQNRQTAEDLAHQAFLVAISKYAGFQNKGPFEAWLSRITVNLSLQYLRDQKKKQIFERSVAYFNSDIDKLEPGFDIEQSDIPADITKAEILAAINILPEHHRLVFNLYVIDHFTHAQIGALLGIPEGTSKSHLARARKKVRELLIRNIKENKKQNKAFLFFSLPFKLRNLDAVVSQNLQGLPMQPGSFQFPALVRNLIRHLPTATKAVAISLVAISILYYKPFMTNKKATTNKFTASHSLQVDNQKNQPIPDLSTATISANPIISPVQTKKQEKMKSLIPYVTSALMVSGIALDTAAQSENVLTTTKPIPIASKPNLTTTEPITTTRTPALYNTKTIPVANDPGLYTTKAITVTSKPIPTELRGTINGSKLYWSDRNNELILSGKQVKVDWNNQHFTGSGTFSFIGKVYFLVFEGTPVKISETIKLLDKTYTITQLTAGDATRKYGDKAKSGAVEISIAE